jgi:four helix bundle protein
MRDHRKLECFALADELTMCVYRATQTFPDDERFGLSSQLRRAAVSIGANIVEGSARNSEVEYVRLLRIAYSSACELEYELSVVDRLGYLQPELRPELRQLSSRTCRALRGLIKSLSSLSPS